jgi:hypothetical protein
MIGWRIYNRRSSERETAQQHQRKMVQIIKEQPMRCLLCAAMICATVFVLGCGKSKTYTAPDGTKVQVKGEGEDVDYTVPGPDGQKLTFSASKKGVKLPESYPKDVIPVYPGAIVTVSNEINEMLHLTFQSDDDSQKIADWYDAKLKENGAQINSKISGENYIIRQGKKGDWNFNLTISTNEENKSIITAMLTNESKKTKND